MPGTPQLPCLPIRRKSPGLLAAWRSQHKTGGNWLPKAGSRAAWLLQPLPRLGIVSLLFCSIGQVHGGGEIDSPPNGERPGPIALSVGMGGITVPSSESELCYNMCAELPRCRPRARDAALVVTASSQHLSEIIAIIISML